MEHQIRFPHLGIVLKNVGDGINIGGFEIKYYGMIIATGFLLGLIVSYYAAKHENKFDPELVFDYLITMIIPAIVGARLYYVIFSWDYYKNHLSEIIQIRNGGLAIYGGVIAGAITLYIFCKKKHLSMLQFGDVAVKGLLVGQILGRWGNFFNREAFGQVATSKNPFMMRIFFDDNYSINQVPDAVRSGMENLKGMDLSEIGYIQVQPTFLYESVWNLMVLILMLIFRKKKKFDGEVFLWYLLGYGIGRFIIEGFRTDQLIMPVTGWPVSQALSLVLAVVAAVVVIVKRVKISRQEKMA